ncbi:MAG: hypothetical protein EAZ48_07895 [Flavobacteriia bacterium]|nr:MAG: hypothetical protein EAZ48_07895 [Flavobacteriia bacterium]
MSEDFSGFSKKSHLNDEDYYLSEEGYIVFTEQYHLKRGYCCKSGCKHCPYTKPHTKGNTTMISTLYVLFKVL